MRICGSGLHVAGVHRTRLEGIDVHHLFSFEEPDEDCDKREDDCCAADCDLRTVSMASSRAF